MYGERGLVDEAIKAGIIDQGGAWYYVDKGTDNEIRFQGKSKVVEFFRTEPEKYQIIFSCIQATLPPLSNHSALLL